MRPVQAPFPAARLRRLRRTPALRSLVAETTLTRGDLIWPLFVREGVNVSEPIASMPGVQRRSIDNIVRAAQEAAELGIPAICLFPYTDASLKTTTCEEAWNPENLTNRAIRAVKA
ncbi:MAG: porphobilinogen synthase, partial [Cypionkella sp.]